MYFKVFAGTMFCGTLSVTSNGLHVFRNRDRKLKLAMPDYRMLKLVRQ